jgi:outer membrane protein TolC
MRLAVLIAVAAMALSACVAGPDYRKPDIATPAAYSGTKLLPETPANVRAADLDAWWAQFQDSELDSLVDRAMRGNLDLQSAASRIRAAREQTIVAGASGLPAVNADADINHIRLSQNSGLSQLAGQLGGGPSAGQAGGQTGGRQAGGSGFALPRGGFTSYALGFDASWEIDVFGGVRRSVEAAQARAEQTLWASRDSEISVSAEIANDYAQIHALGVLLGEQPDALQAELAPMQPLSSAVVRIPVGLPSDLLRRRPDIRAAERALAASNADIGVAVADLFPKFNLSGMFDFVSLDLRNLLDSASRQYGGTAAISWPIFDGDRIRANIRIRDEQNRQALYAYRMTVIRALQDVEDALTRYADERKRNDALRNTLAEAQSAADVARGQYRAGLVDVTPVLTAQGTVLDAQNQLAQSDGSLDRDLVSLYKALGGGWKQ